MVSVADIIQHIEQELHCYGASTLSTTLNVQACITADVEDTELKYMQRFGRGYTFYFRLRDHDHGAQLASDLGYVLKGRHSAMSCGAGDGLATNGQLYLFIHIRTIVAKTAKLYSSVAAHYGPYRGWGGTDNTPQTTSYYEPC